MSSKPAQRKFPWKIVWILLAAFAAISVTALIGVHLWREAAVRNRAEAAIQLVAKLLEDGRADEASRVLAVTRAPDPDSPAGRKWLELDAETAIATRQLDRLKRIYEANPDVFSSNYTVIEWLQRFSLDTRGELDATLPDTPGQPLLESERLAIMGDRAAAILMLEEARLEGKNEINRHLRLATLRLPDLGAAWKHVQAAYELDGENVDVRLIAGRLMEAGGRTAEAEREYAAAVHLDPANPMASATLANYYLKSAGPGPALEIWRRFPRDPNPFAGDIDFWTMVLGEPQAAKAAPESSHSVFWSREQESLVDPMDPKPLLPVFWRRVLDALQSGDEGTARRRLAFGEPQPAGVTNSLASDLDALLAARAGTRVTGRTFGRGTAETHPIFAWLSENEPEAVSAPWVVPTLFAAHGWPGVANELAKGIRLENAPGWAVWTLAHAAAKANDQAQFAERTSGRIDDPAIRLLVAENNLTLKSDPETVLKTLADLASDPDVGPRATRALVLAQLAVGDPAAAGAALKLNPEFSSSVAGKELEARVAIAAGNDASADAIFAGIESVSEEARVHLARRAFLAGDLDRAEALTRQLAASRPGNLTYAENLLKIEAARKNPNSPGGAAK